MILSFVLLALSSLENENKTIEDYAYEVRFTFPAKIGPTFQEKLDHYCRVSQGSQHVGESSYHFLHLLVPDSKDFQLRFHLMSNR